MFKATRLAVPVLLAAMVLTQAAPALAAAPAPITRHEVTNEVAVWVLPAGQCPNLPADLTVIGTGDRVVTLDSALYDDGRYYASYDEKVTGTAVGTDGTEYTFYFSRYWYGNDPADSADVSFHLSELFLLQSDAAAANNDYVLRNGVDWRWTFDEYALPFDVWPPANFQKSVTYGSPIDDDLYSVCNPL